MRLPPILALTVVLALPAVAQKDWPNYGNDSGGMQFSTLKQINTSNVSKLQVKWTLDTRPAPAPPASGGTAPAPARPRASQATPLVANGIMYLGTPYGRLLAIEPETGKKIWERELEHTPAGRGIANTRERLAALHGDRATLRVEPGAAGGTEGGTIATLIVPYREISLEAERADR